MKIIKIIDKSKALWILKHGFRLSRNDLRNDPHCREISPKTGYWCDLHQGHSGVHLSWWDGPNEVHPIEIWTDADELPKELLVIARLA